MHQEGALNHYRSFLNMRPEWHIFSYTQFSVVAYGVGAEYPVTPMRPVGFRNSATGPDLGFYAARLYSLMRPPRRGWRSIRLRERSATGWLGRGGRRWRLR